MTSLHHLKLITGEEILGIGEGISSSQLILRHPLQITYTIGPKNNTQVRLLPWTLATSLNVVKVNRALIVAYFEPIAELIEAYHSMVKVWLAEDTARTNDTPTDSQGKVIIQ